jgi:hypothetical protein
MEWFPAKIVTGERDKLESTSGQEVVVIVFKRMHLKTAKEYHVLKRCRQFRFIEKLVQLFKKARYNERANPSGEVGRLGKRLTDLCAFTEPADSHFAIENILRARTADFIEQAYGEEVWFIDMI